MRASLVNEQSNNNDYSLEHLYEDDLKRIDEAIRKINLQQNSNDNDNQIEFCYCCFFGLLVVFSIIYFLFYIFIY